MRKLGIVSLALAALLLSGCNQKSEEHKAQNIVEPAPVAKSTQAAAKSEPAVAKKVVQEALPGTPAQEAPKNAASEAKEAVASEAHEAVSAKAEEAKEEAVAKTEEVKEDVAQKTEEAKEAVAAKVEEAKEEAKAAIDGAKLYAKCASCHGPKGERKALGKSAPITGMAKDEVLKKLKEYQAGTLNQYGMGPLMKGQVAGMSEEELEALADYISKLK